MIRQRLDKHTAVWIEGGRNGVCRERWVQYRVMEKEKAFDFVLRTEYGERAREGFG